MNLADPGELSLGQYFAIAHGWNQAHGNRTVAPPTEEEFDLAVMKVRGVA